MGRFNWAEYDNIYDTYRNGEPQKWAITQIKKKGLRDFGAALGPEAAHHIGIGAETLGLRMEQQCANTQATESWP